MADFPDDIMRAAREAYITGWGPQMDRASAERIRAGVLDDTMIMVLIATAIRFERRRCADAVRTLLVPDCDKPADDPYAAAIVHAVEAILEPTS